MIAKFTTALILLCSMSAALLAQDGALVSHPVVSGAPYWATRMITVERTLPNGKQIRHVEVRWEARNSKGWEWSRSPVQTKGIEYTEKEQLKGKLPMTYVLWNPDTRQRFEWCSCRRTTQVVSFDATDASSSDEARVRDSVEDLLKSFKDPAQFTSTKIGTKWLLEMQADGMRATRSVSGKFNGKYETRTQTVETWYSPSLEMPLSVVINDSKAGIIGDAIIAVKRGEPDASLFKVPADQKVKAVSAKQARAMLQADAMPGVSPAPGSEKQGMTFQIAASAPAADAMQAPQVAEVSEAVPAKQAVVAEVQEPRITPLAGFEPVGYNAEMASATIPAAIPPAAQSVSSDNRPAKLEKVKIYKNAPAGWPAGLPPL